MVSNCNLPEKWEIVNIGDIAKVKGGKRLPKAHKLSDIETPYPYIRVLDFKNRTVDQSDLKFLSKATYEKIKNYTISSEDVYISIAGTIGLAGTIPNELNGANLTENAAKLCDLKNVDKSFLVYCLESPSVKSQIEALTMQVTQPKLALFRIKSLKIPLPPLKTQQKIVKILEKAEKLKGWRAEADVMTNNYLKSVFLEMFDHPLSKSKWPIKNLEKLVKGKNGLVDGPYGSSVNTKVDYVTNGEIPVIRTKNVNNFQFIEEDLKFMTLEKFETVKRSAVYPGDVILTKVGTIGNVCIFPKKYKKAVLSTTGSCKITVDDNIVNSIYLLYYLDLYKPKMLQIASTGVQPFLNMKHIKSFKIKIPPLELQNQFAETVQKVEQLKQHQKQSKQQIENLFNTLMQKAFKGELTC